MCFCGVCCASSQAWALAHDAMQKVARAFIGETEANLPLFTALLDKELTAS